MSLALQRWNSPGAYTNAHHEKLSPPHLVEPRQRQLCLAALDCTTPSVAQKTDFIAVRNQSECKKQKPVLSSSSKSFTAHAAQVTARDQHLLWNITRTSWAPLQGARPTASGTAHTGHPHRALQAAAQPPHPQTHFRAKRLLRQPGAPQPGGSRARPRKWGPQAIHSHPARGCAPAPPPGTIGHRGRLCGQRRHH